MIAFAEAHPGLFGRRVELALRGYLGWQHRTGAPETAASFAKYFAPRYARWRRSAATI